MDIGSLIRFIGSLLQSIRSLLPEIESLATVTALILGGAWTWKAYFRERIRYPRAALSHEIVDLGLDGKTLLRVSVKITNVGHVLMPLESLSTRVQQVRPLWGEFREKLSRGRSLLDSDPCEIQWPTLAKSEKTWASQEGEIEPGENDEVALDFMLDKQIETVIVYSYLANPKKKKKPLGWSVTTLYDLSTAKKPKAKRGRNTEK